MVFEMCADTNLSELHHRVSIWSVSYCHEELKSTCNRVVVIDLSLRFGSRNCLRNGKTINYYIVKMFIYITLQTTMVRGRWTKTVETEGKGKEVIIEQPQYR